MGVEGLRPGRSRPFAVGVGFGEMTMRAELRFGPLEFARKAVLVTLQDAEEQDGLRVKGVETGLTDQVLDDPQHPYTQLLVSSVLNA